MKRRLHFSHRRRQAAPGGALHCLGKARGGGDALQRPAAGVGLSGKHFPRRGQNLTPASRQWPGPALLRPVAARRRLGRHSQVGGKRVGDSHQGIQNLKMKYLAPRKLFIFLFPLQFHFVPDPCGREARTLMPPGPTQAGEPALGKMAPYLSSRCSRSGTRASKHLLAQGRGQRPRRPPCHPSGCPPHPVPLSCSWLTLPAGPGWRLPAAQAGGCARSAFRPTGVVGCRISAMGHKGPWGEAGGAGGAIPKGERGRDTAISSTP